MPDDELASLLAGLSLSEELPVQLLEKRHVTGATIKNITRSTKRTKVYIYHYRRCFWCTQTLLNFKAGDRVDFIYDVALVAAYKHNWIVSIWKSTSSPKPQPTQIQMTENEEQKKSK